MELHARPNAAGPDEEEAGATPEINWYAEDETLRDDMLEGPSLHSQVSVRSRDGVNEYIYQCNTKDNTARLQIHTERDAYFNLCRLRLEGQEIPPERRQTISAAMTRSKFLFYMNYVFHTQMAYILADHLPFLDWLYEWKTKFFEEDKAIFNFNHIVQRQILISLRPKGVRAATKEYTVTLDAETFSFAEHISQEKFNNTIAQWMDGLPEPQPAPPGDWRETSAKPVPRGANGAGTHTRHGGQ